MRTTPCCGISQPLTRAFRVYSAKNSRDRIAAIAAAAKTMKKPCEIRGASRTGPSHCVWRATMTSVRNSVSFAGSVSFRSAITRGFQDGVGIGLIHDAEILYVELHFDHFPHPARLEHLADPRIEEVLEQGWPGGREVEGGRLDDVLGGSDVQFVHPGDRLDDAGRMGDAQGAQ